MIAANFLKYPEAQLAQRELDLAGVQGATQEQRQAWWQWLMQAGAHRAPLRPAIPGWLRALNTRARALANSVRAALLRLLPINEEAALND